MSESTQLKKRLCSLEKAVKNGITGIKSVDILQVSGAKSYLIHMRQIHSFNTATVNVKDEKLQVAMEQVIKLTNPYIQKVQENIRDSILSLRKDGIIDDRIYAEGVKTEKDSIFCNEVMPTQFRRYTDLSKIKSGLSHDDEHEKNYLKKILYDEIEYNLNGYLQLACENDYRVLRSECPKTFRKTLAAYSDGSTPEEIESCHREREDKCVEIISESKDQFNVLIFGEKHDFRGAIDLWNMENLENKMGLIVMEPKNMDDMGNLYDLYRKNHPE